jgi:hypothetical protein
VETLRINVASDLSGLTPQAMSELSGRMTRFAEDLIQQAAREEEGARTPGSSVPEITATHVVEADRAVRGVSRIPRRPTGRDAAVAVVTSVSSGSAGAYAGMLHSTWQGVAFGVSLGVGLIFTWIAARR